MGQALGLDYNACKVVMDMTVPDCCAKAHFQALRDFERGALDAIASLPKPDTGARHR